IGLGEHYNAWLYKIKKAVFHRKLRPFGPNVADWAVLDVGCGTGFFLERWKELDVRKIVGIDITTVAIERLRRRHQDVDLYQLDIGGNVDHLRGRAFDAISAFDVLYHIVDDDRYASAIGNIYALLKPGGIFIWSDNFVHERTITQTHQVSRSLE